MPMDVILFRPCEVWFFQHVFSSNIPSSTPVGWSRKQAKRLLSISIIITKASKNVAVHGWTLSDLVYYYYVWDLRVYFYSGCSYLYGYARDASLRLFYGILLWSSRFEMRMLSNKIQAILVLTPSAVGPCLVANHCSSAAVSDRPWKWDLSVAEIFPSSWNLITPPIRVVIVV